MQRFDASGWAIDPVQPVARADAYSLFCAESNARFEGSALTAHARTLLSLTLSMEPAKNYASGGAPIADRATLLLSGRGLLASQLEALMVPVERAWPLRQEAHRIGAAGMEHVVSRARKVFQIPLAGATGDPRAPLALACVLSATLLAAVLPPGEDVLFGIKGARERLAALGLE